MTETIIITGASRGIGAEAAAALAAPGRELVLLARTEEDLQRQCAIVRAKGARATYRCVDFASLESVHELYRWIDETYPTLHGLVLNAGMSNDLDFSGTSRVAWEREMTVNFHAPAELLLTMLPRLKAAKGSIVVVGSLTAFVPFPGNATYAASKAALMALCRTLRVESSNTGLHIGMVFPGLTATALTETKESILPAMSAEEVGEAVARCYDEREDSIVLGAMNAIAAKLFSTFPGTSDRILTQLAPFLVPSE